MLYLGSFVFFAFVQEKLLHFFYPFDPKVINAVVIFAFGLANYSPQSCIFQLSSLPFQLFLLLLDFLFSLSNFLPLIGVDDPLFVQFLFEINVTSVGKELMSKLLLLVALVGV